MRTRSAERSVHPDAFVEAFMTAQGLAAAWSPLSVTGLTCWLDASDTSKLWQNANLSGAVGGIEGTPIGAMVDKSGTGNNFTEASSKPSRQTGGFATPVIVFDGNLNKLVGPVLSSLIANNAYTIFIVYNIYQQPADDSGIFDSNSVCRLVYNASDNLVLTNHDGSTDTVTQSSSVDQPQIAQMRHESGSIYLKQGLASETSASSGNTSSLAAALEIGRTASGNIYSFLELAELLIYNVAVSAPNRSLIYSYLSSKWLV